MPLILHYTRSAVGQLGAWAFDSFWAVSTTEIESEQRQVACAKASARRVPPKDALKHNEHVANLQDKALLAEVADLNAKNDKGKAFASVIAIVSWSLLVVGVAVVVLCCCFQTAPPKTPARTSFGTCFHTQLAVQCHESRTYARDPTAMSAACDIARRRLDHKAQSLICDDVPAKELSSFVTRMTCGLDDSDTYHTQFAEWVYCDWPRKDKLGECILRSLRYCEAKTDADAPFFPNEMGMRLVVAIVWLACVYMCLSQYAKQFDRCMKGFLCSECCSLQYNGRQWGHPLICSGVLAYANSAHEGVDFPVKVVVIVMMTVASLLLVKTATKGGTQNECLALTKYGCLFEVAVCAIATFVGDADTGSWTNTVLAFVRACVGVWWRLTYPNTDHNCWKAAFVSMTPIFVVGITTMPTGKDAWTGCVVIGLCAMCICWAPERRCQTQSGKLRWWFAVQYQDVVVSVAMASFAMLSPEPRAKQEICIVALSVLWSGGCAGWEWLRTSSCWVQSRHQRERRRSTRNK